MQKKYTGEPRPTQAPKMTEATAVPFITVGDAARSVIERLQKSRGK